MKLPERSIMLIFIMASVTSAIQISESSADGCVCDNFELLEALDSLSETVQRITEETRSQHGPTSVRQLQSTIEHDDIQSTTSVITTEQLLQSTTQYYYATSGTMALINTSSESAPVIAIALHNNQLFVTHVGSSAVAVYDVTSLQQQRQLTFDELGTGLYGLAACGTNNFLYVSDYNNRCIHRVDLPLIDNRMPNVRKWNGPGSPCGLSINRNHNVLAVYCELSKVIEYTPQGSVVREISDSSGSHLYQAVQLSSGAMAISRYNPIHGVFTVSTDGQVINSYGNQPGSDVGRMNGPRCLVADDQDYILVADRDNNRILLVNPSLTEARELPLPAEAVLQQPRSLALDQSRGVLYVGEEGGLKRLLMFAVS